jgi:subtilisin-like proprotein convertase family protein
VTDAEVLRDVRGYASAGRIRLNAHVRDRMRRRDAGYEDVRHALVNARSARQQTNGRWRIEGKDLDGDDLVIIAVLEDGVVVVTLF